MAAYVMTCDESQLDTATQTCAVAQWTPESVGLPTLTIAQANEIALACAFLFATAWVFRRLAKFINQS